MNTLRAAGAVVALLLTLTTIGAAAKAQGASANGVAKVDAILDDVTEGLVEMTDRHFHKGEYNHIVHLCRMVVAAHPQDTESYSNAGYLLWSMNRDAEAIALYELGLKNNPNTFFMYDELGQYYAMRKKDYPRAIFYYEKAIACKDCVPLSWHGLAIAYEKTGQKDKALAAWKHAASLKNNPNAASARMHLQRLEKGR